MLFAGEIYALLTALLWAGSALAFGGAIDRVGSNQVNITRLAIGLVLLLLTVWLLGSPWPADPRQVGWLVASGLVGLVFGDTFLFAAMGMVGARVSMLVMTVAPALAAVIAWMFLGERLSRLSVLGMAMTLSGVAWVVGAGEGQAPAKRHHKALGVFFAALGAAGQAGNLVLVKQAFALGPIDGFVATTIRVGASVLLVLPVASVLGYYKNPFKAFKQERRALGLVIFGSFIGPYLGITFSLVAVSNTEVGIAGTIMSTVPVVMLPLSYFLFHEKITWRAVCGAILAVGGVGFLFTSSPPP